MEASQNTNSVPPQGSKDETTLPTPDESPKASHEDFLQSGRTGRRNAMANILGEHAVVTSSDLPAQLEALTTKDKEEQDKSEASTSKS